MDGISIIIVSWNTRELLAKCLDSIERNRGHVAIEAIVVDNNSADGSQAMVRAAFPWVQLICNEANVGFARANNQALKSCSGDWALLLNSDAEILPGTLEALRDCLLRHPEAGVVGGVLLNADGSFQASHNAFPTLLSEFLLLSGLSRWVYGPHFPSAEPAASTSERQVDWVGGAAMMVRRQAFEQVGGLDERYFLYSEEMDWCYAMRRGGWTTYFCPQARVIHHGGQSSNQVSQRRLARLYRSKVQFFSFNYGPLRAAGLRLLVALISILKLALTAASYLGKSPGHTEIQQRARMHWNALWLLDR